MTNAEPQRRLADLGFGESPRWHDGRFWVADWAAGEILALASDDTREVMACIESWPMSIDFLTDGRLLIVSAADNKLWRREPDGRLVTHADLDAIGQWNEIVVDAYGNVYLNNLAFDYRGGEEPAPGFIVVVRADGSVQRVADDVWFPNGMVLTDDGRTLVVAESRAHQLIAFDCGSGGTATNRRVWANLGEGTPDGICIDAEDAIWYADPARGCCVRVREGGKIEQIIDFTDVHACALGRHTLLMVGKERVLTAEVAVPSRTL